MHPPATPPRTGVRPHRAAPLFPFLVPPPDRPAPASRAALCFASSSPHGHLIHVAMALKLRAAALHSVYSAPQQ
ncbi:hypothetical protein EVG20_g5610 [Dentipellis fragilis]|uniref:Uncharacterized protein n=1 Tax=Dentipellis fragilis TaxID=205917 RepID=A0A4Y9YUY5_9AGAM|nr:hypothetical protein EVG20_g5610 [Dentipellis fragilis]